MNTAEHMILANPEVWCSRASPGGGTYGVLISSNFARAISAALSEPRRCDKIVAVARVTANKKTSGLLIFVSRKASHRGSLCKLASPPNVWCPNSSRVEKLLGCHH